MLSSKSGPSSRHLTRVLANTSPIHAANPQTAQQSIMSMEDDEISDQEIVCIRSFTFDAFELNVLMIIFRVN